MWSDDDDSDGESVVTVIRTVGDESGIYPDEVTAPSGASTPVIRPHHRFLEAPRVTPFVPEHVELPDATPLAFPTGPSSSVQNHVLPDTSNNTPSGTPASSNVPSQTPSSITIPGTFPTSSEGTPRASFSPTREHHHSSESEPPDTPTMAAPLFTPIQEEAIQRIVTAALIASAEVRQQAQPAVAVVQHFRAESIGLFWPDAEGDGAIVTVHRDTAFKDANMFLDRAIEAAETHSLETVTGVLGTLLRGEAVSWWTNELTPMDKAAMRHDRTPDLVQWRSRMVARFAGDDIGAQRYLVKNTLTYTDIKGGKNLGPWFDEMLRQAQIAGFASTKTKLSAIYNALPPSFQALVDCPSELHTIPAYRMMLVQKCTTWESLEALKRQPPRSNYNYPRNNRYNNQRLPYQPNRPALDAPQASSNTPANRAPLRSNTPFKASAPKNPCPICNGPHWMRLCPKNPMNADKLTTRAFAGDIEESKTNDTPDYLAELEYYQENGYDGDHQEEVFSAFGAAGGSGTAISKELANGVFAQGKETSQAPVHNAGLQPAAKLQTQFQCSYVGCAFMGESKRKLKLHQQKECHLPKRTKKPDGDVTPRQIVKSSTPLPPGLGEEFRKYKFTELEVKLAPGGETMRACLDTGCGVSLIDDQVLAKYAKSEKVLRRKTSLRVRGLGDNYHATSRFVMLNILIPCGPTLVETTKEVHVVKHLGVSLVLGTDFIHSEQLSIDYATMKVGFPHAGGALADMTAGSQLGPLEPPMTHRIV